MDIAPLFIYGLSILSVLAVGLLGTTRRIGFWGAVFFSVVLTPIGGFFVAVLSGERRIKDTWKQPPKLS